MSLREWYDGRSIFLTGGTGFMGKVLIEKLLRCCPGVKTIYILLREKRGVSPQQRLTDFAKLPLFEKLVKENPEALKKLVAVQGDLTADGLGITTLTKKRMADEVSIVINSGASLKLEAGIKESVEHNTVGTHRVLELAKTFKKLEVFCHLSTAFCHSVKALEEKLYEPDASPRDVMAAMSWMDDETARTVQPSLLRNDPNAYIYTKRLTESLVGEYANDMPIVVCRPSIVTPSLKDPVPGWVDSLNGPVGVLLAGGKGVLRSMMCKGENVVQVIPVDVAINGIIISIWRRATDANLKPGDVTVFNMSSGEEYKDVTWNEILALGKKTLLEYPLNPGLWYPGGTIRNNPFTHYFVVLFCQLIPALFVDFIMILARQKTFMIRVQKRILQGMVLLQYFTMHNWDFKTRGFRELNEHLPEEERDIFFTTNVQANIQEYMKSIILGARVYCLKEPLDTLPRARAVLKWLWLLDKVGNLLVITLVGWIITSTIPSFKMFLDAFVPRFVGHMSIS